jgi:large subunit ribosomal protein L32e
MREARKGKRKSPSTGYRGPRQVRGLHPSGKELIRILNVRELQEIDPENQIVQIGSKVGSRKRTEIINAAEDLDIHVVNPQIRRLEFDEVEEDFVDTDEFEAPEDDDILLDDDFELLEDEEEATE